MARMFAFYKLKPGADVEAFKKHMATVDQPACRKFPGVRRFDVFVLKTTKGSFPFDVAEVIDVDSFDVWEKLCTDPEHQPLIEAWKQYGNETSLAFVQGEGTE